jgi:hypothetical protein
VQQIAVNGDRDPFHICILSRDHDMRSATRQTRLKDRV